MTSLFGHSVRSDLLLLYAADALLCFLAISALLIWGGGVPIAQSGPMAIAIAVFCGLISGASGLYQPEAFVRARRLLVGTAVAGLLLLVLLPLLALMAPLTGAGLRNHLIGIILAFTGAVITTRLGFTAVRRTGMLGRRLCIVRDGTTEGEMRITRALQDCSFEIALVVQADAKLAELLAPDRLRAARIQTIVTAEGVILPQALHRSLANARIKVLSEDEFLEGEFNSVDLDRLPADWLARSNAACGGQLEGVLRRTLDILLGSILVLATLPLLVLTAIAIKLDSRGPVFYRQERVGLNGRTFMLFKFRSMVTDAEIAGAPVWAVKGDARVTRVGRFIRLTRIDEIPQVLNVLRGDMAFVGPRPERPVFVEQLKSQIARYADRAAVKPGITGWAQVNYPYGASVEDARMKLTYDLYYVRRRSLFLDLLILVATVRVVLFQEGSR